RPSSVAIRKTASQPPGTSAYHREPLSHRQMTIPAATNQVRNASRKTVMASPENEVKKAQTNQTMNQTSPKTTCIARTAPSARPPCLLVLRVTCSVSQPGEGNGRRRERALGSGQCSPPKAGAEALGPQESRDSWALFVWSETRRNLDEVQARVHLAGRLRVRSEPPQQDEDRRLRHGADAR